MAGEDATGRAQPGAQPLPAAAIALVSGPRPKAAVIPSGPADVLSAGPRPHRIASPGPTSRGPTGPDPTLGETMRARTALLLLALVAGGCLENEEEIEIRPDGSAHVVLRAKGDAADLCTGYALPLAAPFAPANDAASEWLASFAPDTGGPEARARREGLAKGGGERDLRVEAELGSVEDLPQFWAPEREPYRTAYLERDAHLSVEQRGSRTVYAFERVYRGRAFAALDVLELARRRLDPEDVDALESSFRFTDERWAPVRERLIGCFADSAAVFVRSALASVYTQGDASLPPEAVARGIERAGKAAREVATPAVLDRVRSLVSEIQTLKEADGDESALDAELKALLERLETGGRAAMRSALDATLDEARVDPRTRNAVRARLEWAFTAYDHTEDLGDESFTVRVRMPGTVVDGNYDELAGGAAAWSFKGGALRDRDVVLRVVSVL
jgi:hypothetical protein